MNPLDLRFDTPVPVQPGELWVDVALSSVRAGFPSPADDHLVQRVDLMKELMIHPAATFLLRVRGDSMRDLGIMDGTVVLVDKAIRPRSGHIVIAIINEEFTCKQLVMRGTRMHLVAANPLYPTIIPRGEDTVEIWGVVVAHVHQHIRMVQPKPYRQI